MEILEVIGVIVVFVVVLSLIERRVKTKGAIFTGSASPRMRLAALLLGLFFGGLFLFEAVSGTIFYAWPILAIALIGYGLGSGRLLRKVQDEDGGNKEKKR